MLQALLVRENVVRAARPADADLERVGCTVAAFPLGIDLLASSHVIAALLRERRRGFALAPQPVRLECREFVARGTLGFCSGSSVPCLSIHEVPSLGLRRWSVAS